MIEAQIDKKLDIYPKIITLYILNLNQETTSPCPLPRSRRGQALAGEGVILDKIHEFSYC